MMLSDADFDELFGPLGAGRRGGGKPSRSGARPLQTHVAPRRADAATVPGSTGADIDAPGIMPDNRTAAMTAADMIFAETR